MELRQLRALVAIADTQSFSGAAAALDTVQSNISSRIAKLEEEVGAILVDRTTGELTDAGLGVLAHARNVLSEITAIAAELETTHSLLSGKVRLGIMPTTAPWILPPLLNSLAETHPRLELEVAEGSSGSLQRRLNTGLVDLALIATPLTVPAITLEPLFREEYVLLIEQNQPLAGESTVSVIQAAQIPLLVPPTNAGLREELDAIALSRGAKIRPLAQIDGLHVIASLALSGYGPAILPSSTVALLPSSSPFRAVPLRDLNPRQVGIGRRRNHIESAADRAVALRLRDTILGLKATLPRGISLTADSKSANGSRYR